MFRNEKLIDGDKMFALNAQALPPSGAAEAPRPWRIHGGRAAHLLVIGAFPRAGG